MKDKDKYNKELENLNNKIDDIIEDLKYLLIHCDIESINLLNFHFELQTLFNQRKYIKNILFDLEY